MNARILFASALLALLGPIGARADADQHEVNFHALPCAIVLCDYWTPLSSLGYRACGHPFPQGVYDDVVTEPAPTPPPGMTHTILRFEIDPVIDWDAWICSYPDDNAGFDPCAFDGCNVVGHLCDNAFGQDDPVPVGCVEVVSAPAEPGKRYTLRAYNFDDPFDCPGNYRWTFR